MPPYSYSLASMKMAVRYGEASPNENIDLIACYVHLSLENAKQHQNQSQTQTSYLNLIDLLTEAFCDVCVEYQWRLNCYRYIKKLTPLLYEVLNEAEYEQKIVDLSLLKQYFLPNPSLKKSLQGQ